MVTYLFINHWHWWGLAGLLIIGEILAPCYYFMAIGIAAGLTGIIVRHLPAMPGHWQISMFVIFSGISVIVAHHMRQKRKQIRSPDNKP